MGMAEQIPPLLMYHSAQNIAKEDVAAERGHQIEDRMVEAAASQRSRGRRGDIRIWALALASAVFLGIFVGGRADPVSVSESHRPYAICCGIWEAFPCH